MNAPYDRSYSPPLPTVEIVLRLPEDGRLGYCPTVAFCWRYTAKQHLRDLETSQVF